MHVVSFRFAIGAALVLVALGGRTLPLRRREEQNSLLVASMGYGFCTDGDDGEHTKGATPFLVVKVKPSMLIWSMLVDDKQ